MLVRSLGLHSILRPNHHPNQHARMFFAALLQTCPCTRKTQMNPAVPLRTPRPCTHCAAAHIASLCVPLAPTVAARTSISARTACMWCSLEVLAPSGADMLVHPVTHHRTRTSWC